MTPPRPSAKRGGMGRALIRRLCLLTGTLAMALALTACGGGNNADGGLLAGLRSGDPPDEFRVLPKKPLETPPNYADLPVPTPGGANLTDVAPLADAMAALGGRPGAGGASASDRALLAATGAARANPAIRAVLAEEDGAFRSGNRGRVLERVLLRDRTRAVYGPMILDAEAEAERLRRLGVKVPAFPPLVEQ